MNNKIKKIWYNFWYEVVPNNKPVVYGSTCKTEYRFREERLIGIILTILLFFLWIS